MSLVVHKEKIVVVTMAISPLIYVINVIYIHSQVIADFKQIIKDFWWDIKAHK